MIGGVTLGVFAACVVLFVPMAMAGLHLSRNKMLFFSGSLFITLAIGVHLTPYFPSVSEFVSSVSSVVTFDSRASCIFLLHDIVWNVKQSKDFDPLNNNSLNYDKTWSWKRSAAVIACEFQKLTPMDGSELLNGSWIVIAGDSQARLVTLSLLNLILDSNRMETVRDDLFTRHSDYRILVDDIGMKLDFVWAPYSNNLTDLIAEFKQNQTYPDVLVMGSGLWHMLRITNASDYGESLLSLKIAAAKLVPDSPDLNSQGPATGSPAIRSPHLFWIGIPTLINSMLNTEEKRLKMTDELRGRYDKALHKSQLLSKSGGRFLLLDIESLSWNCGIRCTEDGMHYDKAVYEAAVHILLNALLIESHQRL